MTPLEVLNLWFDAHPRGDLTAARALVVDDLEVLVPTARLLGFDAFMRWYDDRARTEGRSFRYEVEDLLGGETHAAAVLRLSSEHRSWRQVAVYRVLESRIVSIWAAEHDQ